MDLYPCPPQKMDVLNALAQMLRMRLYQHACLDEVTRVAVCRKAPPELARILDAYEQQQPTSKHLYDALLSDPLTRDNEVSQNWQAVLNTTRTIYEARGWTFSATWTVVESEDDDQSTTYFIRFILQPA